MINRRRVTFSIILISLLMVLFSCSGEQNPPKNNERTFYFTDSGPRYMIRYNSSPDKTVSLSDTGYIKSYSSAVSEKPAEDVSVRMASRGLSGAAGGGGVRVTLTDSGDKIGAVKEFFVCDRDEEGNETFCEVSMTLKESGEHCLIWCEDSLEVDDGPLKIKTLQEKFDSIYALETALFGTCSDYTVKDTEKFITDANEKIYIIVMSMTDDSTGGYYSTLDMYTKSYIDNYNADYRTNEARMFYINSGMLDEMEECVSALTHEFQHMLRYICDEIVKGVKTPDWYDEMLSQLAEDIFSGYLNLKTESTAISKLESFKMFTNFGVTYWNNDDPVNNQASYSVNYAFGAYLLRNYGGAGLLAALTSHDTPGTGKDVINNAFSILGLKNNDGGDLTFEDAAAAFYQVCIYTSKEDADKGMSLNKEVEFSVGDITVTAPAIDLMNIRSSQGELISESPVMPFPYSEIIKSDDYAAVQLHPYGFILSDLARDDEMSGEKPIRNAGRIVIELPSNLDVKIYFH